MGNFRIIIIKKSLESKKIKHPFNNFEKVKMANYKCYVFEGLYQKILTF